MKTHLPKPSAVQVKERGTLPTSAGRLRCEIVHGHWLSIASYRRVYAGVADDSHTHHQATPGDAEYMHFTSSVVVPLIEAFAPDLVIVAAGYTAAQGERAGCHVTALGYAHMTRLITDAARGKVVFTLEEGDSIAVVAECVLLGLRTLTRTGDPLADLPKTQLDESCAKAVLAAVDEYVVPMKEVCSLPMCYAVVCQAHMS